ncbi:copper amine oxidase N-terminal domain-containing protein [Paenibacillus chartarius]|uniref:Copper amine oxidase N-terminal domain-containing protein n=1 Tax=Paenibacillus chartarius TaxID=747481 RepID=A0ABV6DKD0_9BACL
MRMFRAGLAFVFMIMMVASVTMIPGRTAADGEIPPKVFVDTTQMSFEVPPVIIGGTTLVQFRPLFEQMGMSVTWDGDRKRVTGTKEGLNIELVIGGSTATVNGNSVSLSQSAQIIDGHTMVPLRFVGESTGAIVHWDAVNREISIITSDLLKILGMTKEEMEKKLADLAAAAPAPSQPAAEPTPALPSEPAAAPQAAPDAPTEIKAVDLNDLQGLYYGWRDDFGGYECGGMCWDLYTFLPDQRIVIGLPKRGGPETIDCSVDECLSYTIKDGQLTTSNGKSLKIGTTKHGELTVNDVTMTAALPLASGHTLQGTFKHIGYEGLVGIHAFSTSWTEYLTFRSDGTFESTDLSLGTLDVHVTTTHSSTSKSDKGTYSIAGNTLTLTYADQTVVRTVFFLHDDGDIQIGDRMFYIPENE